jgi:hypothetical protein
MVAASFDTVADQKNGNIRKPLAGTVLLGKFAAADPITTLVAPSGQILVPEDHESCGWISEDGLTFSKSREMSEVRGWGSGTVLRRDIRSEDNTMQFAALENKRLTHELRSSRDLSGAAGEMSADGEWKYDMLARPDVMWWRAVALGKDGSGAQTFYIAKVFHKMMVTDMDDEAWSDGDDPLQFGVTMGAVPDDELGTLGTEFIFGPGALAAAVSMGLTVAVGP